MLHSTCVNVLSTQLLELKHGRALLHFFPGPTLRHIHIHPQDSGNRTTDSV